MDEYSAMLSWLQAVVLNRQATPSAQRSNGEDGMALDAAAPMAPTVQRRVDLLEAYNLVLQQAFDGAYAGAADGGGEVISNAAVGLFRSAIRAVEATIATLAEGEHHACV